MNIFNMPLDKLEGIGSKRALAFSKLNINSVYDLLYYFPYKYQDRSVFSNIADLGFVTECCVRCCAVTPVKTVRIRKNITISKCIMADETGEIKVSWYNQPYISKSVLYQNEYVIYGKFERKKGLIEINNPIVEKIENIGNFTGKIVPVYSLTTGLSQTIFVRAVSSAIKIASNLLPDVLPEKIKKDFSISGIYESIKEIHFPSNFSSLAEARNRFLFEQYFLFFVLLNRLRNPSEIKGIKFDDMDLSEFENRLPFKMTNAQNRVINEIRQDIINGKCVNRLIQGDVGSGKTVVAAGALNIACKNGYQGVLIAPTEILARQHCNSLKKMLPDYDIRILSSSVKKKEKEEIIKLTRENKINILVGTHALIEDEVAFSNLGMVVCDEQHRFGVRQRQKLIEKGKNPHLLVMTATPIPRTLSLILYGDLNVSVIDELPPGRTPIKTYLVNESYRNRVYKFLRRQIEEGGQAYIICPLVDESKSMELKDATNFSMYIQEQMPEYKVGLLHGKLKDDEKNAVMDEFKLGNINVLVSTTVVEVGVDVPNATLMIVENGERFGLSQLHQLRGRVGRGKAQSYCIVFGNTKNSDTLKRLKIFEESSDGFYISEQDLKLRGPGDFIGTRQSGIPTLASVDGDRELKIVYSAKEAAEAFESNNSIATSEEKRYIDYIIQKREKEDYNRNILN